MRWRHPRLPVALVLFSWLLLSFAAAARAQEQTGAVQGTVKDATGAVLPAATIDARSNSVVGASRATTDARGEYHLPALPPGRYVVTATAPGFTPTTAPDVIVLLGQTLTLDLTLAVGKVTETVNAVAETPVVDVTQSAAYAVVPREVMERLAAGQDFSMLIAFAPGARAEMKAGGQAQIDGASGSENVFVIDGMDTTNLRTGTAAKSMYADFVEQVQVKSSGYNAEFGGSTGGVVNAVTRSGGNQVHGSGGFIQESNWGMGSVRTRDRYSPWDQNQPEYDLTPYRAPWRRFTPLGHIGGPIARDRAWYFGGVAYTSNRYDEDAIFIDDPARATRHFEKTDWTLSGNYSVTARLNNDLRLRFSGSSDRHTIRGVLPTLEPAGATYYGEDPTMTGVDLARYTRDPFETDTAAYNRRWSLNGSDYRADVLSGNVDWNLSPTVLLNVMVGYFRQNTWTPPEARGNSLMHRFVTANGNSFMARQGYPTVPIDYQQASGYTDAVSSSGTLKDIWSRGEINTNLTWFATAAGRHTVKAGFRVDRRAADMYQGNAKPVIGLRWGRNVVTPDARVLSGTYGVYTVQKAGWIGEASSYSYSLWAQDSWQLGSRLTINGGVRAEREDTPSFYKGSNLSTFTFPFRDKIAPRAGFAYNVGGNGRSKIYGSFGTFFDVMKLEMARGATGGYQNSMYFWSLDTYDWAGISCDVGTTGCPGTLLWAAETAPPATTYDPILSEYFGRPMASIDPGLKPMQQREAVVGAEFQVGPTTSLSARYAHKWLIRTIEDAGVHLTTGDSFFIGNPGYGYAVVMNTDYPQFTTPRATRDYDALELRASRRFSQRWMAEASYTYSRLWGNYSGLASSDEDGRTSPNMELYYDGIYSSYDRDNKAVFGRLATDRPHVFTLLGTYDFPWGTSLGGFLLLESGLPQSSVFWYQDYPVFANGRNDLGRAATQSEVDLQVAHTFRIGRSHRLVLTANVMNLFDRATPQSVQGERWRGPVYFASDDVFFGGPWDPARLVALARADGQDVTDNVFYKRPYLYQAPREIRFVAKYFF